MTVNDLDSGLFQCPPSSLEIFLAWYSNHPFLGTMLLLFIGWFLMIVFSVLSGVGRRLR